ncbi:type II toxin-antitoxin system VapC family toxin [Actinoallomurus vinaceus]|uniref:Ribonuclease VapC n=1 Tax=Actinoallomurus vinaceus TaxID=1080074 RepID=A0ABP8UIC1_9ACTN
MIYLDTCALLKLVREAPETSALRSFLRAHPDDAHVSSELARTEIVRANWRLSHDDQGRLFDVEQTQEAIGKIGEAMERVSVLPVSSEILMSAAARKEPFLRTLDAIHLATASRVGSRLTAFVTYDQRLAAAAADAGLLVASPA